MWPLNNMREGIASRWNTCPRLWKKMCLSIPSPTWVLNNFYVIIHPWLTNLINILYPLIAQLVKSPPQCRRPRLDSWIETIPCRRDRLPTPVFLGFPCGSAGEESAWMWETWVRSLVWEDPWRSERLPNSVWPGEFHGLYSPWGGKEFHFHYLPY